ncbi:MAG: hypothetical protein PHS96_04525 [Anaerolineales bacterium]|nr:hypothetical protein [Anaerolineales bacterium]MDD5467050.1 hypothetical protein [Anaerolineales bacterium]
MYAIQSDPQCQRMGITISQSLSATDFDALCQSIRAEASKLPTGWTAAVDLRGAWVDNPFINKQLQSLQETLLEAQAGRVATLLDNAAIKLRLLQAGERTRSNVITRRFTDLAEWERFLAEA